MPDPTSHTSQDAEFPEPPEDLLDRTRIPRRFLVDSGVLMRALEYQDARRRAAATDARPEECRALWLLALKRKHEIVIAPHTVFEFNVRNRDVFIPWGPVQPGNFTPSMVEQLLRWLPENTVYEVSRKCGITVRHVRWDAMIVGCAKSERVDCIFSVDEGMHVLAEAAGLPCYNPAFFRTDEFKLENPSSAVKPSSRRRTGSV